MMHSFELTHKHHSPSLLTY